MNDVEAARKYEYDETTKLDGYSGSFFAVPQSIILDKDAEKNRVTAFSYFAIHRGLDMRLCYSLADIVEWGGRKINKHKNGTIDRMKSSVEYLEKEKYIRLDDKPKALSISKATFNLDRVNEECDKPGLRYSVMYLDEIAKIIGYNECNPKDKFFNNDILLLVFAYLRMVIPRRRNKLFSGENGINGDMIEAYGCFYNEIADDLGITSNMVSKAVTTLKELRLIYSESLPRYKDVNGKWVTQHTLFCNFDKRIGSYTLSEGEEYYKQEIAKKKKAFYNERKILQRQSRR